MISIVIVAALHAAISCWIWQFQ